MIIVGVDCMDCIYSSVDDSNKARIKVYCNAREKQYWWGQNIQCEDMKSKEKEK